MGVVYDKLYQKYNCSILNTAEVASELNISTQTLKRRVKEKKMVVPLEIRTGRSLQWSLIDIAKYLGDTDL
ncbi:hypothetical protein [Sulfuricurvum sp.]|uniref:hypothetical protein n=1 Tax=Sulfuricurvum sp. TaxID=2025608 RepID=UPI00262711FA|nr:hypothetical protein [Sulfuricurvum sp.]MDD3596170.1 hypothetical protein [Sulfuricurvum sp.]